MAFSFLAFESILVLFLAFLVFLIALLKLSARDAEKLPPGRQGWPLVRENIGFLSARRHGVLHFFQPRIAKYGKIFTTHLFGKRSVVSAHAHFNKWVLQNEGRLFTAKYPKGLSAIIGKYGMLSIHGDLHRKLHGVAVSLLSMDKLKAHFLAEVDSMIRSRVNQWIGNDILLQDECRKMVLELMLKHLLGLDPSEDTKEIEREFRDVTGSGVGVLPIRLPGTKFYKAIKAREALVERMKMEIKKREEDPKAFGEDLLSRLLNDQESRLPNEVVIDFVLFLVHAGHHTSARALAFVVKHLTENPEALLELREEHDAIGKSRNGGRLTWEDYKSMKFTRWVINETLRLEVGANMVVREAMENVPVEGYVIPKGTCVILLIDAVHKEKDNYESPLAFNPWRWQSDDLQKSSTDGIFTPFSGGPRLCPGAQFAQMEISVFLHHLVTNCRWEKLTEHQVIRIPAPTFADGFPIHVYPREA
ncbi:abietadienol/abietadienal oxidase-like isoform X2 [Nymphaea colorata]|uniref:abietadienol/abietadienal oxidase-like isoform X2 n=1 Tax=Nymphaea colorata TaxID=210225 RepID=UPI00214EFF10|nr:abietadienol/abietadienal oxidase-like isoform X2 [Nymphaea colorata]